MKKEEKEKIIETALQLVLDANKRGISNYRIAKGTNITEKTIGNYVSRGGRPTLVNANAIILYFKNNSLLTGENHPLESYCPAGLRIEKIIQCFCENSIEKFAKKIGEEEETIKKWIKDGAGMDVFTKIHKIFPEINDTWLIRGAGEMLDKQKIRVKKLHGAYNHLYSLNIIKTKEELAVAIGCNKRILLPAFDGKKEVSDFIFIDICKKYDIFNVEYFLNDKGKMLKDIDTEVLPAQSDTTAYIELLKKNLEDKEKSLKDKDKIIALLEEKLKNVVPADTKLDAANKTGAGRKRKTR